MGPWAALNKRLAVTLALAIFLSSFLISIPVKAQTASDPGTNQNVSAEWPMFRADASHSGSVSGDTLVIPNLLWSYPIETGLEEGGYSSPVIDNGVLYVGSTNGNLYALNATDGTKLWNYSTGGWLNSSPAVYNGIVYVGSLALNATTGDKIWNFGPDLMLYSPTIVNGVEYFGWGCNVYALNAKNGLMLWNSSISSPYWQIVSSPAVVNGIVYIGSCDHNLYALNATNGKQLWVYPTGAYVFSSPTVADGIVYFVSEDENLYALNASTGERLWSCNDTQCSVNGESVAVANGAIYYVSFDADSQHIFGVYLKALNASTGAQLWSSGPNNCQPFPILMGNVLYVGGIDHLSAFKATDGSLLWDSPPTGNTLASPAYTNGVVYVDSTNCNLYAFGIPSATPSQSPTPATTLSVPELSWFVIVPLLLSLLFVAVIVRHRNTRS